MRPLALVLVILAGCAHLERDLTAAKASWESASYEDVIAQWGAPERTIPITENRVAHTWLSHDTVGRATLWPSFSIFGGSGGIGVGTGVTVGPGGGYARCERTLIFQNDRVVDQSWHGDADYCRAFARGHG